MDELYSLKSRRKKTTEGNSLLQGIGSTLVPDNRLISPQSAAVETESVQPTAVNNLLKIASMFGNPATSGNVPISNVETNNALLNMPQQKIEQPAAGSLLDYWAKPAVGKIPLDQFVHVAGMLSNAIAPNTPMGRVGAGLSQLGGAMYGERLKREDEVKIPTEWGAFYKEHRNTVNPTTGKPYTILETLKDFKALNATPREFAPANILFKNEATGESTYVNKNDNEKLNALLKLGFREIEKPADVVDENRPYFTEAAARFASEGDMPQAAFYGSLAGMKPSDIAALTGKEPTAQWKLIKDKTSGTGFSYQNMSNPAEIRQNAAEPPTLGATQAASARQQEGFQQEDKTAMNKEIAAYTDKWSKRKDGTYINWSSGVPVRKTGAEYQQGLDDIRNKYGVITYSKEPIGMTFEGKLVYRGSDGKNYIK